MIDAKRARELFDYDPRGILIWKDRQRSEFRCQQAFSAWNTKYANTAAGSIGTLGYIMVRFDGRMYRLHRLIWLYVYGVWPMGELDHINGVPGDNRLENLRECSHAENHQNRGVASNNKSGLTGISWYKRLRKWRAEIKVDGKQRSLGLHETKEQAHQAYLVAKQATHTFQPTPRL